MKIVFAGTPDFALPSLLALIEAKYEIAAILTQPDKPAGRGQKIKLPPVKIIGLEHNIPIFQPKKLDQTITDELNSIKPDIIIVAAYGLIFPEFILTLPRYGCINIHASWLPRWRGAAPLQHAILSGDTETGISIMRMEKGLDTGDLISISSCSIADRETTQTLNAKLSQLGAQAILEALENLKKNNVTYTPQQAHLATYAHKIEKKQAQIQWKETALTIDRMIRAFQPWPVAYSSMDNKRIRFFNAYSFSCCHHAPFGTILNIGKTYIDVACRDSILRVLEIQWENEKIKTISEILNTQNNLLSLNKRFDV